MQFVVEHIQTLLLLGLVFTPLELIFPEKVREHYLRPQWWIDVAFALVNVVFIAPMVVALILLGQAVGEAAFPGVREWVAAQSMWLQVPGALILTDFAWYWTHRLAHRVPLLWRFHAVHHSIENMDWMAGHRVHPLDQTVTRGSGLVIILALGFTPEAFVITGAMFRIQGAIEHANINFRGGWLRHVVVMPEFHHWHHANHPEAYDRNFGGHFSFFDHLFGTWFESNGPPEQYGSSTTVEGNYVDMLFFPFRRPVADEGDAEQLDQAG